MKTDDNRQGQKDAQKLTRRDLRIKLNEIVTFLKKQGYPLENTYVSYYSAIFSAYVNCNLDPISNSVQIAEGDLEMIENAESLRLKFQKGISKQYRDNTEELNDAEVEVESEHSAPSSGDEYKAINLNTMLEHDSDQKFNANVGYLNQKKG